MTSGDAYVVRHGAVTVERCWADRQVAGVAIGRCREEATSPVGLCDPHHTAMVEGEHRG